MKVSELGEFRLIDLLEKMVAASKGNQAFRQQLVIGIGDDAAVWQDKGALQLATTDSLVQDVHFSLDTATWYELGWKALAVSLSDIAAMGGVAQYALVTLALPPDTEVEDITALFQGMLKLAQPSGLAIAGGDIVRSSVIMITTMVTGSTPDREHVLMRSAAKPGERIAVTGYPGAAAAGMKMLQDNRQPDSEATAYLRQAFLQPEPRLAEGMLLVSNGVKAAIDISDGLMADLTHICQASHVGARVEVDRLPIAPAVKDIFGDNSLELALSGGEDYELLFTASTEIIEKVARAASCPITVIGEITAEETGKIDLINKEGGSFHLNSDGWDHFVAR
ncbi:thiamine-phosphate kinase [Chloroflexota bacterium]